MFLCGSGLVRGNGDGCFRVLSLANQINQTNPNKPTRQFIVMSLAAYFAASMLYCYSSTLAKPILLPDGTAAAGAAASGAAATVAVASKGESSPVKIGGTSPSKRAGAGAAVAAAAVAVAGVEGLADADKKSL